MTIDLPFGISDLDKVFRVTDLLDNNKTELIDEFRPEVAKFLVREGFFKGPFKREYDRAFDEMIIRLIRNQLVKHFPDFSPEEIVLLTDADFLHMITADFYFNPDNYRVDETNNTH